MATIMPHSQLVAKAVKYALAVLAEHPYKDLAELIDDAAMRFNLSPKESDSLLRLLREATERK